MAIATCMACPVRAHSLELPPRHWDLGQPTVWMASSRLTARNYAAADPTAKQRDE